MILFVLTILSEDIFGSVEAKWGIIITFGIVTIILAAQNYKTSSPQKLKLWLNIFLICALLYLLEIGIGVLAMKGIINVPEFIYLGLGITAMLGFIISYIMSRFNFARNS